MSWIFAPENLLRKLTYWLDRIETWLWQEKAEIDTVSESFYTFKPYPASLKAHQRAEWADVQTRMLTPFVNGDTYHFLGKNGVSIWANQSAFKGIPETAAQRSLEDGTSYVKTSAFYYYQRWQDGQMLECITLDNVTSDVEVLELSREPFTFWARRRRLDGLMKKPAMWAGGVGFIFVIMLCWQVGGYISLKIQSNSTEAEIAELEQKVGDKLRKQADLKTSQNFVQGVNKWQREGGGLPQVLAHVFSELGKTQNWDVALIEWQLNVLRIEMKIIDVNIAELVARLERSNNFERVSIRPNSNDGEWILEVVSSVE